MKSVRGQAESIDKGRKGLSLWRKQHPCSISRHCESLRKSLDLLSACRALPHSAVALGARLCGVKGDLQCREGEVRQHLSLPLWRRGREVLPLESPRLPPLRKLISDPCSEGVLGWLLPCARQGELQHVALHPRIVQCWSNAWTGSGITCGDESLDGSRLSRAASPGGSIAKVASKSLRLLSDVDFT